MAIVLDLLPIAWKKAIQFFFDEVGMSNNLFEEISTNSAKAKWKMKSCFKTQSDTNNWWVN